jgi:hypothetical protein
MGRWLHSLRRVGFSPGEASASLKGGAKAPRGLKPTLLALLAVVASSQVLDRIAVTVDKQVITQGDLIRDLRVGAFLDRKPVDLSPGAKRAAAGRLVDQILMLREAGDSHLVLASLEDAAHLVSDEKSKYSSEQQYRGDLARYGISEADVSQHLLNGLRALRFSELRFRPQIQLSEADLQAYYDKLAASWRQANRAQIPTFEESRSQVEKLLTADREIEALDAWLAMTRRSSRIEYREAAFQ